MIATGTDRLRRPRGVGWILAAAGLAAVVGCSSSARNPTAPSGLLDTSLQSSDALRTPALSGEAQRPEARIIRIEPDPERDAQVHSLLREALDHLRSGEIQPALDLLLAAQSIEGWMRSEHAPAVLFWTGHSYDQLGERYAAMGAFRRITAQYPNSAFAERATRRLRELRNRPERPEDQPRGGV